MSDYVYEISGYQPNIIEQYNFYIFGLIDSLVRGLHQYDGMVMDSNPVQVQLFFPTFIHFRGLLSCVHNSDVFLLLIYQQSASEMLKYYYRDRINFK